MSKEPYAILQTAFRPSCMNRASVFEWQKRFKGGSLWVMMRGVGGIRKSIDQSLLVNGLGLLCWGFKGVQEERLGRKRPALFRSGLWHFHQDNAPVHNSIHVTDYLTKIGIKTVLHRLYSRDVPLSDFWLFPKLISVVMRQMRRWKRLWRRSLTRFHKRIPMGPCRSCWNVTSALQPEEITSKGTIVSCVYYQ